MAAQNLPPEVLAVLGKVARWLSDNGDRIMELKAKVDAEVDRRIATHPDLADLDDWLDDMFGVEW